MDRITFTQTDRFETMTRGAAAGLLAGGALAALEMAGSMSAGAGPLRPWRMASSILFSEGAFTASPVWVLFTGVFVHLAISMAAGVAAATLYEWSELSRIHRLGQGWACVAGVSFGSVLWMLDFAIIGGAFFPWMWRLNQAVQLVFHLGYGAVVGLAIHALGFHARNRPDWARPV